MYFFTLVPEPEIITGTRNFGPPNHTGLAKILLRPEPLGRRILILPTCKSRKVSFRAVVQRRAPITTEHAFRSHLVAEIVQVIGIPKSTVLPLAGVEATRGSRFNTLALFLEYVVCQDQTLLSQYEGLFWHLQFLGRRVGSNAFGLGARFADWAFIIRDEGRKVEIMA